MYTTEISYISNYYADLTPSHLAFIAAINNFSPPNIYENFSYCELGCGCGKTTSIVAAGYPHANCVGIDINARHIDIAKKEAYGLDNIEFHHMSFGEALGCSFEPFDFIVMHGVWSWVNDAARNDIVKFLKKFLKKGGVFYISYDSMPGWSQMLPFHKIMSIYTSTMDCSVQKKAEAALAYLQFLNVNKSDFFETSPNARMFLEILDHSDIRYVVHELFNENLRPEYFCDVNKHMEKAGLVFVGDNYVINNYDYIMPEQFKNLLATSDNRICTETHKSIIRNDKFRRDVYGKFGKKHGSGVLDCCSKFLFGVTEPFAEPQYIIKANGYTLELNEKIYQPIFEILSKERLTINDLSNRLRRDANQVIDNIINCMMTQQITIFLEQSTQQNAAISDRFIFTDEYNQYQVSNWRESYSKSIYLASKLIGDAIAISKRHAMILFGINKFGLADDVVLEFARRAVSNDMSEQNVLGFAVDQDITGLLALEYDEVKNNIIPLLCNLKIIHRV